MTNQYVTISVTEDDKTLTVTREKLVEWPGWQLPHISELIDEVCVEAKELIIDAEREAAAEPF